MPDATKIWEGWEAFQRLHGWTPYAYHRQTKAWWRQKTGTVMSVSARTPEEACKIDRKLLADGEHVALPVLRNCYSCKHSCWNEWQDGAEAWLMSYDNLGDFDLTNGAQPKRTADNCPGHEWASNVLGGDHE